MKYITNKSKITAFAVSVLIFAGWIFYRSYLPDNRENTVENSANVSAETSNSGLISNKSSKAEIKLGPPEISGWIAWWEEKPGFDTVDKYKNNLSQVSPSWLKLDKNQDLVETRKANKIIESQKINSYGLALYPMVTTDLTDHELADFVKNNDKFNDFIEKLIQRLDAYNADGLDLDFENIREQYSADFTSIVEEIASELHKNNLKLSVAVQAQTGQNDWAGLRGQNISQIAQNADIIRIMIYDKHGESSDPGPITPMSWYKEVIKYNLNLIPRDKLIIGLPTYGYIWSNKGSFDSFQYADFIAYAKNKRFEIHRDPESFELKYSNSNATGWLSDSTSVIKKIDYARSIGLNRFVIWNLGRTDEKLLENRWDDMTVNLGL